MKRPCRSPYRISICRRAAGRVLHVPLRLSARQGKVSRNVRPRSGNGKERKTGGNHRASRGQTVTERQHFEGFSGEMEQAVLGDLLLCFCLEKPSVPWAEENRSNASRQPITWQAGWIFPGCRKPPLCSRDDGGDAGRSKGGPHRAEQATWKALVRRRQRLRKRMFLLRAFPSGYYPTR